MGSYRKRGHSKSYRTKKAKQDQLRCKACGILFEYSRGRPASEFLALHIRLDKQCNRYYNEEVTSEH